MEQEEVILAVQKMQDYMEKSLHHPVTLHDLARIASYSPWHANRIFKEYTGRTPFDYLRNLRLSKAAISLRDKQPKVIEVAFDFVFDSHEGFTRAFSRQFGVSPKKYSMNPTPIPLFLPFRVHQNTQNKKQGDKKMSDKKTNTVFVQVVERPERKVIMKRGIKATDYFEYCEETGCDVWGMLVSIKEAMYEPVGMWLPEKMITPGTSLYVQGVEVPIDYQGEVPEGYDVVIMAPCKMMVFQGEPFEDELYGEAISELWEVIKTYNPEIYGFMWAEEDAPRIQLEPWGYRGYIEARPVRMLVK